MKTKDPNRYKAPAENTVFEVLLAKLDKALADRVSKMKPSEQVPA